MQKIILASASPRRKELLSQLGITFTVETAEVEERRIAHDVSSPKETVCLLAEAKAKAVLQKQKEPHIFVLGADTVVAQENRIFHKPKDEGEAFSMLLSLSGKKHTVYTGFALLEEKEGTLFRHVEAVATDVFFRTLTEEEIHAYIATGEPMDKAGAYGIQGKGAFLVERVEGDYNAVVGLPLSALYCALKKAGVSIRSFWQNPLEG